MDKNALDCDINFFGLVWVFPDSVRSLFLEWKVKGLRKNKRSMWRLAPICLFSCIWGEQNRRTFQEEEMSDQSLRKLFTCSLFFFFLTFWVSLMETNIPIVGLVSPFCSLFGFCLYTACILGVRPLFLGVN